MESILSHELLRIAGQGSDEGNTASSLAIAIQLLGLLKAEKATQLFFENLQNDFQGLIMKGPPTLAAKALARLGPAAVPEIIKQAASANNDEWIVLERTLEAIDEQNEVRQVICGELDTDPGNLAEMRLDQYVSNQI